MERNNKEKKILLVRTSNAAARRHICKTGLKKCERKTKKPQGRQKLTWLKQIKNQLEGMKIQYQDIEKLISDRFMWRTLISEGAMPTMTL